MCVYIYNCVCVHILFLFQLTVLQNCPASHKDTRIQSISSNLRVFV